MAKTDLLNFLKDINYVYNDCGMYDCVSKMLEDFEAEIRAKAIGVMGMAMKEYYPSCKGAYVDFDVYFHAVMAKVAEQMEEGAD